VRSSCESVSRVVRLFPNWDATPSSSERTLEAAPATPVFFASVASKGLINRASLLFAILAGRSISVATKGVTGVRCWRESNGLGW